MIDLFQSIGSLVAAPGNGLETFGTFVALGVLALCLVSWGASQRPPS